MELDAAIVTNLDKLVEEWLLNATPGREMELEAVFGEDGVVDATTFVAVAQRLQAKGYSPVQQDDRLSILVPEGLRFSIEGAGVVPILQNYCRDDVIQGKPFTVLRKSSHSPTNKILVQDYGFYLKNRVEELVDPVTDPDVTALLDNWAQVNKGFRLIKRWAFEGKGMKIDMSMVRSTPSINGAFQWQKKFKERDIFKQPIRYEIEVELKRCDDTKDLGGARRCLVQGIGEILRAIQKNTFLIKQPEAETVLRAYAALNKTASFRGVQPITMEVKHMVSDLSNKLVPNIRNNYNVTDKADGLRVLAYCNSQGELFLLDGGMTVYKTGLRNKACTDSILDGEWVTRTADHKAISYVLLFDIYTLKEADVSNLPFHMVGNKETRHAKLNAWIDAWNGDSDGGIESVVRGMTPRNTFQVKLKQFQFADPENPNSIFSKCALVLSTKQIYHTDGLILTPNLLPLPKKSGTTFWEQFKWKPAEESTIDFLIEFEKKRGSMLDLVETGTHPDTGESVRYKTLRLYVKSDKDSTIMDDPRTTILEMRPLRKEREDSDRSRRRIYKPTYFIPTHYPDIMANTCYLPVHVVPDTGNEFVETETKEALQTNTIVEMRYDRSRSPGWQWIPMRIRHDKTERLAKGISERTMNSDINANGVWNSIHNPVTFSMITTGAEKPSEKEIQAFSRDKRYYNRAAPKEDMALIRGLRDFHNHYIKGQLLYKTVLASGPKTILDLACGQGGDMDFWYKNKAAFVLGADIDLNNIRDKQQGIYRRYLNYLTDSGKADVPPMVFVQADSAKPLLKGEAAFQSEDKNILRSLFARERADTSLLPPLLSKVLGGRLKDGADVAVCMFALHYFFKNMETLDGFLANLRDCVKVGGYFIGCCTDGKQVFRRLKDLATDDVAIGKEGETLIWSIAKKYDAHELRADESSVGLPIDVNFMSIGTEHTEYLVSFDYLTKRLDEIGFALLTPAELTTVGLTHSTNLFGESYKMVPKGTKYPMSEVVKEFSFLSRWFIFKRQGETGEEKAEVAEVAEVAEEAPKAAAAAAVAVAAPVPPPDAIVEVADIFQFGPEVRVSDPFKIGDTRTPNIVAPFWPWTIEEEGVPYPSLEHYWAAMKLIHASNKPEDGATLALRLLSSKEGKIHQDALGDLSTKGIVPGTKMDPKQRITLVASYLREVQEIRKAMASVERVNKIIIDEAKWNSIKDEYYRKGLTDRWDRDELFHKIVDKARVAKKYLLYVQTKKTGDPTGELSGVRDDDGRIAGGNKIGRFLMEIAKFSLA